MAGGRGKASGGRERPRLLAVFPASESEGSRAVNGEEQASWIVTNWEALSMIVAGVLTLLGVTGKAVTLWRALKLVMSQLEGAVNRDHREDVKEEAEAGSPGVAAVIRNMAARVDPKAERQPKLRDAVKGVALDAVAGALSKLFRRGKKS